MIAMPNELAGLDRIRLFIKAVKQLPLSPVDLQPIQTSLENALNTLTEEIDYDAQKNIVNPVRNKLLKLYQASEQTKEIKDALFPVLILLSDWYPYNDLNPLPVCFITLEPIEDNNKAYYVSGHLADKKHLLVHRIGKNIPHPVTQNTIMDERELEFLQPGLRNSNQFYKQYFWGIVVTSVIIDIVMGVSGIFLPTYLFATHTFADVGNLALDVASAGGGSVFIMAIDMLLAYGFLGHIEKQTKYLDPIFFGYCLIRSIEVCFPSLFHYARDAGLPRQSIEEIMAYYQSLPEEVNQYTDAVIDVSTENDSVNTGSFIREVSEEKNHHDTARFLLPNEVDTNEYDKRSIAQLSLRWKNGMLDRDIINVQRQARDTTIEIEQQHERMTL